MTIHQFLTCTDKRILVTKHPNEIKGIVVNATIWRSMDAGVHTSNIKTVVFFDFFYVVVDLDLVEDE